jgi:Na+/melibiose symporter-like transporter
MAEDSNEISAAERSRGQRNALLANLFGQVINYLSQGPILLLYANDVLGLTPGRIGAILAVVPLAALFRIPFLRSLERFGKVKTLVAGDVGRAAALGALLLIPADALSFGLFLGLLLVNATATQISAGAVWQPLLRDITTVDDRGQFFARMRFFFTLVSTAFTGVVPLVIGEQITEPQFKILLGVAMLGLLNHALWTLRIPESHPEESEEDARERGSGIHEALRVLRSSPLMRLPVLIFVLIQFGQLAAFPLFSVYFRTVLEIPANTTSLYFFAVTVGQAVSLLLWGRVADTIGFRPLLVGLMFVSILSVPLLLLIPPGLGVAGAGAVFIAFGVIGGAVQSGTGIAVTSIEHYHTTRRDSVIALNLFSGFRVAVVAVKSLVLGLFIEQIALPVGSAWVIEPVLSVDAVKVYMLVFGTVLQLAVIVLARRLPNLRPHFGVADFFSSLSVGSIRSMIIERRRFQQSEEKRVEVARILGAQTSPLAIDQLIELLDDPALDVKVEAVRSLAHMRTKASEDKLLELLADKELSSLHDHVAWALGELRSERGVGLLLSCLADDRPDSLQSTSARALGKIGNPAPIDRLRALVSQTSAATRVRASACIALIVLDHEHSADLILGVLAELTERAERYEVMNALCGFLGISNEWLLRYLPGTGPRAALLEHSLRRPKAWQATHDAAIWALNERDVGRVRELFLERVTENEQSPTLAAMRAKLVAAEHWQPVLVLAAAWLLLRA